MAPRGLAPPMTNGGPGAFDRFRSFAERYLIQRADSFTKGNELQDGWRCIMDARKLYGMIEQAGDPTTGARDLAMAALGNGVNVTAKDPIQDAYQDILDYQIKNPNGPVPGVLKLKLQHAMAAAGLDKAAQKSVIQSLP